MWLFRFLKVLLVILLFFKSLPSAEVVYIYSIKKNLKLPPNFFLIDDLRDLCKYKKVVIFGAESFRVAKNIVCPSQRRYVAGVLYISYFYSPKVIYISPLPSKEVLKGFSNNFVVIDSGIFDFYFKYLEGEIRLRRVEIKEWYDLEKAVREIRREPAPLLLLPDPLLIDERARIILKRGLEGSEIRVFNLMDYPLGLNKEVLLNFKSEKYFQFIYRIYLEEPMKEESIYYFE